MFNQSNHIATPPQKKTSGQISGRHHLNKPCLVCDLSMAVRVAMQPARMQHHIGVCGWLELGGRISLGTWADLCWIPTDLQYIIGPLCHLSTYVMDPFILLFRSIEIPLSDLLDTLGWLTQTPIFCYFNSSKFQIRFLDSWDSIYRTIISPYHGFPILPPQYHRFRRWRSVKVPRPGNASWAQQRCSDDVPCRRAATRQGLPESHQKIWVCLKIVYPYGWSKPGPWWTYVFLWSSNGFVWKWLVPLNPMVND